MNSGQMSRCALPMPRHGGLAEDDADHTLPTPRRPSTSPPPALPPAAAGRLALISEEAVLGALRQLARGRGPWASPLAGLAAVHRRLVESGLVPSPRARQHELGRLLDDLAAIELDSLRHQSGIVWRSDRDGGPAARLRADFSHNRPELEAWSALHYLYLSPEYALGLDDVAHILGDRHRRTLQRRLARGVTALTARLYQVEVEATGVPLCVDQPWPPRSAKVAADGPLVPIRTAALDHQALNASVPPAIKVIRLGQITDSSGPTGNALAVAGQLLEAARTELGADLGAEQGAIIMLVVAPDAQPGVADDQLGSGDQPHLRLKAPPALHETVLSTA